MVAQEQTSLTQAQPKRPIVFFSYAREDEEFIRLLSSALNETGIDVYGDWRLEPLIPYVEQLHAAISSADAFLFVISPDSVKSQPCREEIEYAVKNHKRLAPIVRANVADESVHSELRKIQYVFFRDHDDFNVALRRLSKSILADLDWVQSHTYFLERALYWERKQRKSDSLMRGSDLNAAEQWLAVASTDATKDPRPTELQTDYISASRQEELREQRERAELMESRLKAEQQARTEAERREEEQKLAAKRLRRRAALLALALGVAVGAAILAVYQLNVANARRSAALALSIMFTGYDRALLLSAQAYEKHKDSETLGSLLAAMQRHPRILKFLRGQTTTTWNLAFSPDGKILASSHGDGTILLWDATNYEPLAPPLRGHSKKVKSVVFSPDGTKLASGSEDKTILLWDLATRQPIGAPLVGHKKEVQDIAFSPDGKTLASASNDETVMLWEVASGKNLATLRGHSDYVWCVEFSPDGKLLASGSADDTIILWDAVTREEIESLSEHTDSVLDVSFSPDGSILASASADDSIILWDVKASKSLGMYLLGHTNDVSSVSFSRDGRFLASSGSDNTVRIWNVSTHVIEDTLTGHAVQVNFVAFAPDGKRLVSGGWDNNLILWDTENQHRLRQTIKETESGIESTHVTPSGKLLAGDRNGEIILQQAGTTESFRVFDHPMKTTPFSIDFSPDGKVVAVGNSDDTITLWDVKTRERIGAPLRGHEFSVASVSFSPDGQTLVSGSSDGTVIVWDVATGKPRGAALRKHTGEVNSVVFSPDGKRFASAGDDQTVILWNAGTLLPEGDRLFEHRDPISKIEFSPDSRLIASSSLDNEVVLWDLHSRKSKVVSVRRDYNVTASALSFSRDGRKLAFVNDNNNVVIVDVASGKAFERSHSLCRSRNS